MDIKRVLGPLLAATVAVGVGTAVYVSATRKSAEQAANEAAAAVTDIKGMIGSEKESFFIDPRVADILLVRHRLRVKVEKVGSREIAVRDFKGYDFGFPAGAPAAIALQKKSSARQVYPTFFTPIAVASWKSLVPILQGEGIVKQTDGAYYISDLKRLQDMIQGGTRWRDLKNNTAYATGKSILISTTDVRTSNSAAMYLALASYLANGNNVVDGQQQMASVLPFVTPLFLRQGLQEASSAGPFEDYTTMGMGKAPLVLIYESQFLEYQARRAAPNTDMVLLYPQPTTYTKHIVVPFTEAGHRLGNALATDVQLQKLAAQYGYRTAAQEHFTGFLAEKKLTAPAVLIDVIDPPSFETLERMIVAIEEKLQ